MMMSTRLGIPTTYLELGRLHLASGRVEHVMCHVHVSKVPVEYGSTNAGKRIRC